MSDPTPSDVSQQNAAAQQFGGSARSVERAREGAHRLVDRVADRAADRAGEYGAVPERWVTDLQQKVASQPIMSVVVAAAAGILFGRLFDRR